MRMRASGVRSIECPQRSREPIAPPRLSMCRRLSMTSLRGAQDSARVTLKVGPGLAAFLAGLDKFLRLFADWPGYRTPLALAVLPVSPSVFITNPQATARLPRGKR